MADFLEGSSCSTPAEQKFRGSIAYPAVPLAEEEGEEMGTGAAVAKPQEVVLDGSSSSKKESAPAWPAKKFVPKPRWLIAQNPNLTDEGANNYKRLQKDVKSLNLATVCQEARCPNIGECWAGGTATIMLMGDTCTRGCRFCNVKTSKAPPPLDPNEPDHVSEAVAKWGLNYVVVTTVDRDDLPDQGAFHIAKAISLLKEKSAAANGGPEKAIMVETLLGDFRGNKEYIRMVAQAGMDVFAHNIETVERLTPTVRDRRAKYRQTLDVLETARNALEDVGGLTIGGAPLVTKSSIMLGLGETEEEIEQTLRDLRLAGVEIVTLGQYLQPSKRHMKVARYVEPAEFDRWKQVAEDIGFAYCASGPLVRSSYRAGEFFTEALLKKRREEHRGVAASSGSNSEPSKWSLRMERVAASKAMETKAPRGTEWLPASSSSFMPEKIKMTI